MDCQMPVMDGYAATRAIREQSGNGTQLPVIAMTANAMAGDREKVIEAGMQDHIAKPLNVGRDVRHASPNGSNRGKPAAFCRNASADFCRAGLRHDGGRVAPARIAGGHRHPGRPGSHAMNNPALYLRHAGEVSATARDEFRCTCSRPPGPDADPTGQPPVAAHTLKGTAGNIGARALCRASLRPSWSMPARTRRA
jgi:two-component system sensor histidine kinase/response regulator